jgi:hypothetical protein
MYKINGTDLFSSCGFLADGSRESSNSFERPADPAEVFTHAWDNGFVEYDLLTIPRRKARVFLITGYLHAKDEADYLFKKQNFDALIRVQIATIYAEELGVTVNAKLNKITRWERVTPIKNASQIMVRVGVEFNELVGIDLPVYGLFYGASALIPATSGQVQALTASPSAAEVILQTGSTYRIFSIAIQQGKAISSVNDLDGGLYSAISYTLRNTVAVNGVTYNVYALELWAPYSTNHRHKITIA